jgi:hypothetical protein
MGLTATLLLSLVAARAVSSGAQEPAGKPATEAAATAKAEVATASRETTTSRATANTHRPAVHVEEPTAKARGIIAGCQARFLKVNDYTCTFYKRERIDGKLTSAHIMEMKARTSPHSLYFKFVQPKAGREAIYVKGRNQGKVVAHDVGLGKFFAGTMHLDPLGTMAMEENRHPVTEAGIGNLIDTVVDRWNLELRPGVTQVVIHPQARVGDRRCLMVETVHPDRTDDLFFYAVKLYIDQELGLPIRFEGYDWPKGVGKAPELVEEYTYTDLKVNVGLSATDFDPTNAGYSFGRF